MNDADLKALGRLHTVDEAMAAVAVAASIFERFSFDLIYARPGQTPAAWEAELQEAIARAAEHLSLYQLTIEPDTLFERLFNAGKLAMPDADLARALYDVTQERRARPACPPTRFPTTRGPAPRVATISSTGATANMPASAPARMAGCARPRAASRNATEKHPEMWLTCVETEATASSIRKCCRPKSRATNSCSWACG